MAEKITKLPDKPKEDLPAKVPAIREDPEGLAEDQLKRGYYYDDSHGYTKYDPLTEESDAEDN